MTLLRSILIAGVAFGLAWIAAHNTAVSTARQKLDQTLLLTTRAVDAEVDRLRALPNIAAQDVRVRAAIAGTGPRSVVNSYLATIADQAGADQLYLIDASGETIAASNWNSTGSFVGQNYGFRPYFRDAIETGIGQFYAIGVTTGVPGYFFSSRVDIDDAIGVLVVKIDLRPLQDAWRAAEADIALADENGVIFLSARTAWQYRPLTPLLADVLEQLAETKAFTGIELAEAEVLLSSPPQGANIAGNGWIGRLAEIPATGWQVVAAQPTAGLQLWTLVWAVLSACAAFAIAAAFNVWEQRRQLVALRLSQAEKLESMVSERTADLAREVDARTQAEANLHATQQALIHNEKIAALGRMSAAIVHEINQPLAAMEATLMATQLGLASEDEATKPRLEKIRGLIRRMQRTTRHLKSFARKEDGDLILLDMRRPVVSALEMVAPRARVVRVEPEEKLPPYEVPIVAGIVRIEQVVVNLLLNALDAVEGHRDGTVTVGLRAQDGLAHLEINDTGSGIGTDDLPYVAEPFFSTKQTGDGLGLGLSICKAILDDFGGTLNIRSTEGQGTNVAVTLPLNGKPDHRQNGPKP